MIDKTKDYQDEISFELFQEIMELGIKARLDYGEKALSDVMIGMANSYRTKLFELQHRQQSATIEDLIKKVSETFEKGSDDISDEELMKILPKDKIM